MAHTPSGTGTYVVLFSSTSGRRRWRDTRTVIRKFFEQRGISHRIITIDRRVQPLDALDWTDISARTTTGLIVVGGDGMLRAVAEHLFHRRIDVPIGYIPHGSTNLFGLAHGLPLWVTPGLERILHATPTRHAIGIVNGTHVFLLAACFGQFADYTLRADAYLKRQIGFGAYAVSAASRLFSFPRHHLRLTGGNESRDLSAHSILVCTPCVSTRLLPKLEGAQSSLRTLAFHNTSIVGFAHALAGLYGLHRLPTKVMQLTEREIALDGPFTGRVHLDGDTVEIGDACTLELVENAVSFLL